LLTAVLQNLLADPPQGLFYVTRSCIAGLREVSGDPGGHNGGLPKDGSGSTPILINVEFGLPEQRTQRGNKICKADVQQYLELYGRSMLRSAIDPQGHIYQEGNWIYAALTGDRFLHDVAQRVCRHQASRLTVNYKFGGGSGDAFVVKLMRQ